MSAERYSIQTRPVRRPAKRGPMRPSMPGGAAKHTDALARRRDGECRREVGPRSKNVTYSATSSARAARRPAHARGHLTTDRVDEGLRADDYATVDRLRRRFEPEAPYALRRAGNLEEARASDYPARSGLLARRRLHLTFGTRAAAAQMKSNRALSAVRRACGDTARAAGNAARRRGAGKRFADVSEGARAARSGFRVCRLVVMPHHV